MNWIPGTYFVVPFNDVEAWIGVATTLVVLAIKIFAFSTSLSYSAESYLAADRWNKPGWCLVLGIAIVLQVVPLPLTIVNLAFVVAACVFLADVRPALAGLHRR